MIGVNINGKDYDIPEDITVFDACKKLKINIPSLCYDDRLAPNLSCNLCVVEVEGQDNLLNSCSLKAKDSMKILTHSDKVIQKRKEALAEMLKSHSQECTDCHKSNVCKLKSYCKEYKIKSRGTKVKDRYPIDKSNPFYDIDPNKCILCGKCINVCRELQGRGCLEINEKGYISRKNNEDNMCESCGNCLDVCPTGAIKEAKFDEEFAEMAEFDSINEEEKKVKTTCSYCGVGCQLELLVKAGKVVEVKPVNVPPNNGLLCVKGKFGYKFINHPDRLKTPLIKKNGKFVEATWEEAYTLITDKAKEIKNKYGGSAFGGLSSARCTNEENYLFQKLIRAVFGTNNIDHCARL
ncbi:NADPH-Fe(3+) oxidoreductase subunit alpha [Oxobacter pfennigii]|uniref:NADPH-Fe(3+) oxidoreductase subunit alpha n=3 Tax=Oxobacter pfennigii TaxID=36849 RepID=A0A0P9AE72_9CLOT|nr:NADPH-Fe(3+) oxidoreductase subunit alpha [Oxobacter pfennigii]